MRAGSVGAQLKFVNTTSAGPCARLFQFNQEMSSLIGLLLIFVMPKSRHANKISLPVGLCLKICHFDKKKVGKFLETSLTLQEKKVLVGTKPNKYLNFLPII